MVSRQPLAAPLIACAAGCASPGPPQPPSLNLPEVVKDLTAERVGDVVQLHWTTPDMTTDRLDDQRRDDGGDLPHHGDISRTAAPGLHPGHTVAGTARPDAGGRGAACQS